jgi:hypothetical protein
MQRSLQSIEASLLRSQPGFTLLCEDFTFLLRTSAVNKERSGSIHLFDSTVLHFIHKDSSLQITYELPQVIGKRTRDFSILKLMLNRISL